jgi:hypothetical protein
VSAFLAGELIKWHRHTSTLFAGLDVRLGGFFVLRVPITDRAGAGASAGFQAHLGEYEIHQDKPEHDEKGKFKHGLIFRK